MDVISSATTRNGSIMSPHYPSVYPAHVHCRVTLRPRADVGERVQLVFVDFSLHYPKGNPRDPHEFVSPIV